MAYVIGGYSWQHFDISTKPSVYSYDWGANGLTIGTGVEAAFSNRLTGFLEYRYTFYDSENFNSGGLVDDSPTDHTFRVGLKYKLF
jgi:outer membrane immunogenic protein